MGSGFPWAAAANLIRVFMVENGADSRTDKSFRRFLNDYAAVAEGKYSRVDQLPEPSGDLIAESGQYLRIVDLPSSLDTKMLRVDLYRVTKDGPSTQRMATAENLINGKLGQWQSSIAIVAERDSDAAKTLQEGKPLPAGRYTVRIFIDRESWSKANRDYEMGQADLVAQVEFGGEWKVGYLEPKIIRIPN